MKSRNLLRYKSSLGILYRSCALIILFMFTSLPLAALAEGFDCSKGNHDYGVTTIEPTKNEDGETIYTCKICGFTFSRVLPATGHSWSEWITNKQPTCTEPGRRYRFCTRHTNDPHTEEETIPALGHKYTETITPATCEKDGIKTYKCERCGHTYTQAYGGAFGHSYIEKSVKEPDCEHEGEKELVCEHCGDTYTEVIPSLGHSYGQWIVDKKPTETEEGHRYRVCGHDRSHIIEEIMERLTPAVNTEPAPPDMPEDTNESFPNRMDIILLFVLAAGTVGFGVAIYRDLYILQWEKNKSISFIEWLKK